MGLLNRSNKRTEPPASEVPGRENGNSRQLDAEKQEGGPAHIFNLHVIAMIFIVSLGGLIFGYDTGQISGFLEMQDFLDRFGNEGTPGNRSFSNTRSGTIVGLLSIGTLVGALIAAPIADRFGRKISIVFWNIIFCVGVIVQITATYTWYQVALGRFVAGFGVGALSVLTPMYQSETAPRAIRGALVSCYQLFITLGIFIADCINFGTKSRTNAVSWRLPMGIGFIWPALMAVGILFLRESPRWDYRRGNIEAARRTVAIVHGVPENHWEVEREIKEIKAKLDAEAGSGGKYGWIELFTAPRMAYRTLLGMSLQSFQQLTGANYLFYYGTTIFSSIGISDSFVTAMILGGINFGTTFCAPYVVEHFGRRKSLITGGLWCSMCFLVFASVGHFALNVEDPTLTPTPGYVMIVFACLFIFGYAATWGPIVWCITGEIYPSRYRAKAMGLTSASNWIWNFLLAFFTPFITGDIDFAYGYVFAGCCAAGAAVTYFFVCESQGRTLEEIDTMYLLEVKPWKSSKWVPPEELVTTAGVTGQGTGKEEAVHPEGEGRIEHAM